METPELPPVITAHLERMARQRHSDLLLGYEANCNGEDLGVGIARHPELSHQRIQDLRAGNDLAILLRQLQDPNKFLHTEPIRTPLVHLVTDLCHATGRRCILTQSNRDWWLMTVTRVGSPPFAAAEAVTDSPA